MKNFLLHSIVIDMFSMLCFSLFLITGDKRYKKSVSDATIEKVRELQEKREQVETEEELAEINQEIENELKVVDQKFVRPAFTKKLQGNLPGQKRKSLS